MQESVAGFMHKHEELRGLHDPRMPDTLPPRSRMTRRYKDQVLLEFERWGFDVKGWANATRSKYLRRVKAADAWLEENRGTSILWAKPDDLKAYVYSTTTSARNRNNVRQALVGFYDFMVDRGWIDVNPALALSRLPEPQLLPKALDVDQASRILAALQVMNPMDALMVTLMLYGGLRKSEVRLLQWRDVSADNEWVTVNGKGSKQRMIPLHETAQDALIRWRVQAVDAQWVFPSPRLKGRPVSESYIKGLLYEVGELAGVPGLHPHLLRHTAATRLLEKGATLREVQEFLGHADPKTTAIYTKVRPANLKDAVARLDYGGTAECDPSSSTPCSTEASSAA